MKRELLQDWARPLLAAVAELERVAREFPGDASMLREVERLAGELPLPEWTRLAEDMRVEMEEAAGLALEERVGRLVEVEAFAAENPGFSPLAEAVRKVAARTPVGSRLNSAQWGRMPLALRERGQFSAGVESIRVMGEIQRKVLAGVSHQREILESGTGAFVSRDSFIRDVQQAALDEGLDTGKGNVLTNIASKRRLGLIYDMQRDLAAGFAQWSVDQDADALAVFPAWRLGRSWAKVPRTREEWLRRWVKAGAEVAWEGALRSEMVALKTSPIWRRFSRFGTPWPPFDFGSTRELEDVWRDEAERLGLLGAEDVPQPDGARDFNEALEASAAGAGEKKARVLKDAFGEQVLWDERGQRFVWQGGVVKELVERTLTDRQWNGKGLVLGKATEATVRAAEGVADLRGVELVMDPGHVRKTWRDHGPRDAVAPGSGERRKDHLPLERMDYEMVPHLWRDPDEVLPGNEPGDLVFRKRVSGRLVAAVWRVSGRRALLKTLYRWRVE